MKKYLENEIERTRSENAKLRAENIAVISRRDQIVNLDKILCTEIKEIDQQLQLIAPQVERAKGYEQKYKNLKDEIAKCQDDRKKLNKKFKTEIDLLNEDIARYQAKTKTEKNELRERIKKEFIDRIEKDEFQALQYQEAIEEYKKNIRNAEKYTQTEMERAKNEINREFIEKKKKLEADVRKTKEKLTHARHEAEGLKSVLDENLAKEVAKMEAELEQLEKRRDALSRQ